MPARTHALRSTSEAVSAACDLAEEVAQEWSLPPAIADALLLVMGEAADNAAGHANAYDPDRQVTIVFALEDGRFRVCVEDEGEGISEDRLATADLPEDELATSGRGLFIIRSLAEEVWLEAGGRRLCAAWTLPPEG